MDQNLNQEPVLVNQELEVLRGEGLFQYAGSMTIMEMLRERTVDYVGRIHFGEGSIDASHVSEDAAMEAARNAVDTMQPVDYMAVPGNCMDGRTDKHTEAEEEVEARPKVIGGPAMFTWTVAEIADLSIVRSAREAGANALERFGIVAKRLNDAGFKIGGHFECGAIRGAAPVQRVHEGNADKLSLFVRGEAKKLLDGGQTFGIQGIVNGANRLAAELEGFGEWTEEAVLGVIRDIAGSNALVHLNTDHHHPNHGHEEEKIIRNRVSGTTLTKYGHAFMHDVDYAKRLIEAVAISATERANALLVGETYPLAGVATLGKDQHVIDIDTI
jgi:hypothetical protein